MLGRKISSNVQVVGTLLPVSSIWKVGNVRYQYPLFWKLFFYITFLGISHQRSGWTVDVPTVSFRDIASVAPTLGLLPINSSFGWRLGIPLAFAPVWALQLPVGGAFLAVAWWAEPHFGVSWFGRAKPFSGLPPLERALFRATSGHVTAGRLTGVKPRLQVTWR